MFRAQGKNWFITYPKCSLTKSELQIWLKSKFPTANFIVVSQEQHQDGTPHLHAYISCATKKDIKDDKYLDKNGFHPNIQTARDAKQVYEYVIKHGDVLEWGTKPNFGSKSGNYQKLLGATTKEDFMKGVMEEFPHEYIFHHEKVQYYCEQKFKSTIMPYTPRFTSFIKPHVVEQWLEQRSNGDRPKSLILWGPTRLGKTELARSFGKHMYFNTFFDLHLWDDSAEYAIWDDMENWSKFIYKPWVGAQRQFTVTDKYARKRTVQWGKPSILLMNQDPSSIDWDYDWIKGNCFILKITGKLYNTTS